MQKLRPYHIEALYDTLSKTPCGQYVGCLLYTSGGLGEGYVVLSQLVPHPCHIGDIAVQHLADLRRSALAVEGIDTHQQGIQLLLSLIHI